jgi:uncharacterized membrane protein YsdA (DUF1294 family)
VSWATRFRIREHVRGSLWVLPMLGGVTGALLGIGDVHLDQSIHLPAAWTY